MELKDFIPFCVHGCGACVPDVTVDRKHWIWRCIHCQWILKRD